MKSLPDQILELQLEIAALKRTAGHLKKLESRYRDEKESLTRLEQKASKEYQDILNLNKKNWAELFFDLQKEKKKKLEKEKQEYYQAVMNLKNAEHAAKLLEFEINILREKVSQLPAKEERLRQLKLNKKNAAVRTAKKETDQEIVLKNRFRAAFHKLIRSGQVIQVYLEAIGNALNLVETWQNWNHLQSEKKKIFEEEFDKILKNLSRIMTEVGNYRLALENIPADQNFIRENDRTSLENIPPACTLLKEKLTLFAQTTLSEFPNHGNLQNELTKLKANIVEIQYSIDQTKKLTDL